MGLLTGFSLISGVEIIYFIVKILVEMLGGRLSRSKENEDKDQITKIIMEEKGIEKV